ncbi:hypothetical protein SeLEV6574_g06382 [Synchytrium endobioticum]|uniref:Uncharacterized protein n=2 Tax=Synchytrium endobioticum TaxID=286115 RepID=A0A507CP03_9FUNG|nr:hypothetical protein SeLEV6574_g06382 [Synchytrium endobioticum]
MTKESCTVPSSMKTLPGQALVTTATSNRDLPEEQDVDCGRILAELTMVSERMCTLVDRTRMFYAMKVVQDLLPPVGNNRAVTRKWTYSRVPVDSITVRNNLVFSEEDRSAVLEALADVGDVDYLQGILNDWRKRESALFTCFGRAPWPKIFISEDGKWTWGTCQHDTILSSAKTFSEEKIAGIASVTFKFQQPDYRVMVMTRSAADECVGKTPLEVDQLRKSILHSKSPSIATIRRDSVANISFIHFIRDLRVAYVFSRSRYHLLIDTFSRTSCTVRIIGKQIIRLLSEELMKRSDDERLLGDSGDEAAVRGMMLEVKMHQVMSTSGLQLVATSLSDNSQVSNFTCIEGTLKNCQHLDINTIISTYRNSVNLSRVFNPPIESLDSS